jgi:hypothetical protein
MDTKLTFQYDREGDILYINTCPPYPEQESDEIGEEVIACITRTRDRSKTSKCCSSRLASCVATFLSYLSQPICASSQRNR